MKIFSKVESKYINYVILNSQTLYSQENNMKTTKIILAIIGVALLTALDQWSKMLATRYLMGQADVNVFNGILSLTYHTNAGAAFGILQGGRWFFLVFAVVILIAISVYYVKLPHSRVYDVIRLALVLVAAGGVGNSIDRLVNDGHVVDFLRFDFINFPIFNIADIFVTVGAGLVIVCTIVAAVREGKSKSKSESDV